MPGLPIWTRRHAALAEQALVSGAHLVAFVLFARRLPPADWGEFGLAYATVVFVQGFQRAWITIPMIPFSTRDGWAAGRAGWLGRHTALLVAAVGLLAIVAAGAAVLSGGWIARALALASMLAAPLLLHELSRRAAVQEERWPVLAASGLVYAAVLLPAAWLTSAVTAAGPPSAWAPTLSVGLAATASVALYAGLTGQRLWARPRPCPLNAEHSCYSGWATLCHLGHAGYNFGVQALLAALAGPAAVGLFHACRTLVQPVATLASALDSIDKPRAAAALAAGGAPAMRRLLMHSATVCAALALPYLMLVALAADPVLAWLYADHYDGQSAAVWLWCVVALFSLLTQPVESGLYIARRTRSLFQVRAASALASLVAATLLVPAHGTAGALAAMALGFALAALLGFLTLQRLTTPP